MQIDDQEILDHLLAFSGMQKGIDNISERLDREERARIDHCKDNEGRIAASENRWTGALNGLRKDLRGSNPDGLYRRAKPYMIGGGGTAGVGLLLLEIAIRLGWIG